MRNLKYWLLLLCTPIFIGNTFAQTTEPQLVEEEITIDNPFNNNEVESFTIEFIGFKPAKKDTSVKDSSVFTVYTSIHSPDVLPDIGNEDLINSSVNLGPETSLDTQRIIGVNTVLASFAATYALPNPEKIWTPKNFKISTQMQENPILAQNIVLEFEGGVPTDKQNPWDENYTYHKITKPYDFNRYLSIRARTNIGGLDFLGPVIDSEVEDITKIKKARATYALFSEIVAKKLFYITGSLDERSTLQIPDSSMLFSKRSGDASEKGTFLGRETALIDYTGTSSDGTIQFRTIMEKVIDFLKKMMVPVAVLLVAYSGVELFLSFQNEERMSTKIRQLTGVLVGFLGITLAVNIVDWVVFGSEGQILRGDLDVADFARRGFTEISGLFDFFTSFAVIIVVAFIVFNSVTLILAGGEDESQISAIKKRILYSLIGLVLMITIRPLLDVFTSGGQLVMPEVRGTITVISKWLNFIIGFIGLFAVVSMIYAGIMMIVHFGDESQVESAKNIMKAAAIGLILAFSSWVVVYYFVFAGQV